MKKEAAKKQSIAGRFIRYLWNSGPGSIDDFSGTHGTNPLKRKLLSDIAYQLEQAGTLKEISRRKEGKKVAKEFKLTEKGMMRAVKLCVEKDKLKKLLYERRLIIFDIPEKQRFYRDYFRQLMKDLDCSMVQLSVWQADFELPEDFLLLVGELGLQSRVIVYKVRTDETMHL